MGRTVGELKAVLSTDELADWMAFSKHSPIGEERMDYLFARLCLLVCEVGGAKKQSGSKFTFEDFLLWKPPPKPMTDKELMMQMFGSRIIKKAKD